MEANGLSSDLIQIEALRERDRRLVVQPHRHAFPVIKDFDVLADRKACRLTRSKALMIDSSFFSIPQKDTYFAPSRTLILQQAGQAFHAKVDTDFTASWT